MSMRHSQPSGCRSRHCCFRPEAAVLDARATGTWASDILRGNMSQETVELVRRSLELYNALGVTSDEFVDPEEVAPDVWSRLAPDVELHERAELPDAKVYRGRAEAKEFWRKTQELFSEIRWEPHEFSDLGHAVLVQSTVVAVGRGSDVRVEMDTDVFWFREGLIVRIQGYATKPEALAAAGRDVGG